MDAAQPVTLEVATADDAPLLSNLLSLYIHDLSEIFPIEVEADGRFVYDRLPLYWSEPARRFAFLIRAAAKPAGFALVTRGSPASDDPECLDLQEFFVLRRLRRAGVGADAALALWRRLPGHWVVRVSEGNRTGLPFWQATVGRFTRGDFAETRRPGSPHPWRVFEFESPSAAPHP